MLDHGLPTPPADSSFSANNTFDLCIIGGGLAGISAALEARKRFPNWRILLTESRQRLGGRAGSFTDPKTGTLVDNCQHVGLGCCNALIRFVHDLDAPDAFRRVTALKFLSSNANVDVIQATPLLPPPLHLAPSFLKIRFLSFKEKIQLAYAILKLAATPPSRLIGQNTLAWLQRNHQSNQAIRRFWEPVLVSALNDNLDRLDAAGTRQVFVESFFKSRHGYHLLVPATPLGQLFDTQARKILHSRQIEMQSNQACQQFHFNNNHFHLTFRNDHLIQAKHIILATPWETTAKLLSKTGDNQLSALANQISQLKRSPITGIHLQLDSKICDHSEIALLEKTIQWVFDHTQADLSQPGSTLPPNGQSLHLVISASHALEALSRESILNICLTELKQAFPAMNQAKVISSWVVTEHSATFSPCPGASAFRPKSATPLRGLYLAGDWTQTGWPATMEGAIRSGQTAAHAINHTHHPY